VSAKAGEEAVKRKKEKGGDAGVCGGGRRAAGSCGQVAECEMSEVARKAAASKIVWAIGIEVMHKQAYMMATLVRNEEQFMADFANGVVCEGRQSG
jgi:hypothetical protein